MAIRSLLSVPGDSERKIAKARDTAAAALILNLEDSAAPDRTPLARDLLRLNDMPPGQYSAERLGSDLRGNPRPVSAPAELEAVLAQAW